MNRHFLIALIYVGCLTCAGCRSRSPIGVDYVGPDDQLVATCALYGDKPSADARMVLQFMEAESDFEEDPKGVLERIHFLSLQEHRRNLVFTLAELAYLLGKRTGDRDAFLLSALAAYTYLEGETETWGPSPSAYDRRFRWSCELYGRALGRAFAGAKPGTMELVEGLRTMPVGTLDVSLDMQAFPFETQDLVLLLADEYKMRGLNYHLRDSGLGTPLIAVVQEALETTAEEAGDRDQTSVAATAFLKLEGDLTDLEGGLSATLALYSTYDARTVQVGDHVIPLNSDQSATVAYGTELAGYWRHDLAGLFGGGKARQNGLILPRPYEDGRIPVVLVHGTASSPTYWAELLNVLGGDPLIRSKFQFWLYQYDSGNPIAYSAANLREELQSLCERHDPNGDNPFLNRMVLVGHSQGGLLVKMLGITVDSEKVVLKVYGESTESLGLTGEQTALVRRLYDLDPLPEIDRMIFIATPHRGSTLADSWFARTLTRLISVPGEMAVMADAMISGLPRERLPRGMESRVHTSLDNMDPNSLFVKLLLEAPIDPEIHLHSIIPIGDYKTTEGASDGVVKYSSAHIDAAESEVVVPSGHSCQTHPRTLLEVRRILYEEIGLKAIEVSDVVESETPGEEE